MRTSYKKYTALIFASALAAAAATNASAHTDSELIAAIPDMPNVISTADGIPDMPNVVSASDLSGASAAFSAKSASAEGNTLTIESVPDMLVVLTVEDIPDLNVVKTVTKNSPALSTAVTAQTNDTPEAQTNDTPVVSIVFDNNSASNSVNTPDTAETNDTPDTAQTSNTPDTAETSDTPDEPYTEIPSPLSELPSNMKRILFGDVDFDEIITSFDALRALRISFFGDGTPLECEMCDVDFDKVVTSADALEILRNSNGLSDSIALLNGDTQVKWVEDKEGAVYALFDGNDETSLVNIEGFICGINADGRLLSGEVEINGETVVLTESGILLDGWHDTDSGKALYNNGTPADGWVTAFDQTFYFENNAATIGWKEFSDKTCYFDENGVASVGFKDIDGRTYYFDSELDVASGLTRINGKLYFFFDDGGFATGWTYIGNEKYYFNEDGSAATGWTNADGSVYYFISETEIAKNVYSIDGTPYFFGEDGKFETGFVEKDYGTIFKDEYGFTENGFKRIGYGIYYFDESGIMTIGETVIDGSTYVFNEDGVMTTGWYDLSSYRAYLLDGKTVTGSIVIDGQEYYFQKDGTLRCGLTKEDGALYYRDENGLPEYGMKVLDNDAYYFGDDGKAVTGFVTVGDNMYYFGNDFKRVYNTTVGLYRVDENGVCHKLKTVTGETIKYKADDIIEKIGTDPSTLCWYVHNNMVYSFVNEPMVYSNPYAADWASIAAFAANRGYGACYHYSAFLHVLFQRAGITSRIVVGTGYYTSLHSFNQILVDGQWLTYDALYATCGTSTAYMQSIGYTYNDFIEYYYD